MPRRPDQRQYDVTVAGDYLDEIRAVDPNNIDEETRRPEIIGGVKKKLDLKYARNPGFTAAWYVDPNAEGPCLANANIIPTKNTKDPGYINIEDASRALRVARDISEAFPGHVSGSIPFMRHSIEHGQEIHCRHLVVLSLCHKKLIRKQHKQ
jgi:AICAR transformylase/IMP cyclohydrolase PurH